MKYYTNYFIDLKISEIDQYVTQNSLLRKRPGIILMLMMTTWATFGQVPKHYKGKPYNKGSNLAYLDFVLVYKEPAANK